MKPTHARILAYVNRVRKAQGKEPLQELPKGSRVDAECCPVGKGMGLSTAQTTFMCGDVGQAELLAQRLRLDLYRPGSAEVRHPRYVTEWIRRFDDGKYPELVA